MRIKDKLQFLFEHLFISAAIATLHGVSWLRLYRPNAHNPAFASDSIRTDKSHMRVVSKLSSEKLLARKKGVVQLAVLLDFFW